jgi:hypothetical protein
MYGLCNLSWEAFIRVYLEDLHLEETLEVEELEFSLRPEVIAARAASKAVDDLRRRRVGEGWQMLLDSYAANRAKQEHIAEEVEPSQSGLGCAGIKHSVLFVFRSSALANSWRILLNTEILSKYC